MHHRIQSTSTHAKTLGLLVKLLYLAQTLGVSSTPDSRTTENCPLKRALQNEARSSWTSSNEESHVQQQCCRDERMQIPLLDSDSLQRSLGLYVADTYLELALLDLTNEIRHVSNVARALHGIRDVFRSQSNSFTNDFQSRHDT
jgi:hypothetical protein